MGAETDLVGVAEPAVDPAPEPLPDPTDGEPRAMSEPAGVLVGIVRSVDDGFVMAACEEELSLREIPFEVQVQGPTDRAELVVEYARQARSRGLRVLVAAVRGSSGLAARLAHHCELPVVAVPIAGETLGGLDALISTTQTGPEAPVATVAVGGARTAAALVARILAVA